MSIAFPDVVENCQTVRETDCPVVGITSRTGVTESEVHVLLWVVGERTARESWECLCDNKCECCIHHSYDFDCLAE